MQKIAYLEHIAAVQSILTGKILNFLEQIRGNASEKHRLKTTDRITSNSAGSSFLSFPCLKS